MSGTAMDHTGVLIICVAAVIIAVIVVCGGVAAVIAVSLLWNRSAESEETAGQQLESPEVSSRAKRCSEETAVAPRRAPPAPPIAQMLGLHPYIALTVVIVDFMLTALDVTGVGWPVSCAVAAGLGWSCYLMQKSSYGDSHDAAFAKALIVGVLTAIPTPLPSCLTGASGLVGLVGVRLGCGRKDES